MTDQRNPAITTGTNALVVGIANEHSYAFHIAKSLKVRGRTFCSPICPERKWSDGYAKPSTLWGLKILG